MPKKLNFQLELVILSKNFERLIGQEILYQENTGTIPRYIYWARVLAVSPNNQYIKFIDLDQFDALPYYKNADWITILDAITPDELV